MTRPSLAQVLAGCSLVLLDMMTALAVQADQIIADDTIAQSSLCVGADCVNNESFGFDTIRLKGENLRIGFDDTSTSGGFPANDWEITVNDNDSTPGGSNYFAITDATAGNQIFRVDAGAPQLSLRIDSSGNLNLTSGTGRITNLADPVNDTDAVNLRTLKGISVPAWIASSSALAAQTSGSGSTAVGAGSSARTKDTAVGYLATVTADDSTAVGASSLVLSANSVAVGANATVGAGAAGGTAIGQNARVAAGAANSVALGKDSVATAQNTVSVGSPGNERRIANVANGINTTDAVNVRQLNGVSSRVAVNSRNISKNAREIALNREAIIENSRDIAENGMAIAGLRDELEDSSAGIAAAASLIVLQPSAPGKTMMNFGAAEFKGEAALGLTLAHRLKSTTFGDALTLSCGVSAADEEMLTSVGGTWNF